MEGAEEEKIFPATETQKLAAAAESRMKDGRLEVCR